MKSGTKIGDALFTKTQQRVLGLLYGKPDKSFYSNEIVRWADMGKGTVRRELERLSDAGLLLVRSEGNQRHYQANAENPVYDEILGIVRKTFGLTDVIYEALSSLSEKVEVAFIYGSIAKGEETSASDIDLLIVADDLSYSDVITALTNVELLLGRPVNPTVYSGKQLKQKIRQKNAFVLRIMDQPKLWVQGGEDDIKKSGQPGKSKTIKNRVARSAGI